MRDEIMDYVHYGWHVIPLHGVMVGRGGELKCTCGKLDCHSPGKHPVTQNGLKNATVRKDWIEAWWKRWPFANVGIVTGQTSGLVVVDIDPRHGGDESLDALFSKHEPFPDTVEVMTGGGGRHFYFRHPGVEIRNSANRIGRGVDVRGDGGYVLAPPSEHISGRHYEWEGSSEPGDVPIADMPQWLVSLLSRPAVPDVEAVQGDPGQSSIIAEGGRDNFMTACAGAMRRWGMTHEAILSALRIDNDARCRPPLADSDLMRIAKSVMRYPQTRGL